MKLKAPQSDKAALGGMPKHERLRAYLLKELSGGRLKPGDALPTEHALAISAEVSRNTVRHALAELARSGLIRRGRGCGTFVDECASGQHTSGLGILSLGFSASRR